MYDTMITFKPKCNYLYLNSHQILQVSRHFTKTVNDKTFKVLIYTYTNYHPIHLIYTFDT